MNRSFKLEVRRRTGRAAEVSLVENLLRENLSPLEEAVAMQRLKEESHYKNNDIANFLGKSPSIVSETLSLNRLPKSIKKDLQELPDTPKRVLIKIAALKDPKKMAGAWRSFKRGSLSQSESQSSEGDANADKRRDRTNILPRFVKSTVGSL